VVGADVLLIVFGSLAIGVVCAVNVNGVPAVLAFGVTGILITLFPATAIPFGVVHITLKPVVLVHVQPLSVNIAGVVVPAGKLIVVVNGPLAAPVPILATVTGMLLG
jgi:hypothetical protein